LVRGLPNLLDPNETRVMAALFPKSIVSTNLALNLTATSVSTRIEVSNDLVSWTTLTNIAPQSSAVTVNVPVDPSGQRFFRAAP
jgi:hypothetical protein